jgi:hypothetical protein
LKHHKNKNIKTVIIEYKKHSATNLTETSEKKQSDKTLYLLKRGS